MYPCLRQLHRLCRIGFQTHLGQRYPQVPFEVPSSAHDSPSISPTLRGGNLFPVGGSQHAGCALRRIRHPDRAFVELQGEAERHLVSEKADNLLLTASASPYGTWGISLMGRQVRPREG